MNDLLGRTFLLTFDIRY